MPNVIMKDDLYLFTFLVLIGFIVGRQSACKAARDEDRLKNGLREVVAAIIPVISESMEDSPDAHA